MACAQDRSYHYLRHCAGMVMVVMVNHLLSIILVVNVAH